MFKRKKKQKSESVTQQERVEMEYAVYEFIADVKLEKSYVGEAITLYLQYRVKGSNAPYTQKDYVVASTYLDPESKMIREGLAFMDKFDERLLMYAEITLREDEEKLIKKRDRELLIELMNSKSGHKFEVKFEKENDK
ncbi:hypothetical protein AAXB25_14425 [Paenibacillus lautus]|uniref:hypothetical protein n=1 Tax=Paenibacillus lautus TaxID=1401 RepID=UPI003D2C1C5C